MHGDDYPTDDVAAGPAPDDAVRLEAAVTLIHDDEPDALARRDGTAVSAGGAAAQPGVVARAPTPSPPLRVILAFRPRPGEEGAAPAYDVTISADRGKEAGCDPYWWSFAALDLHGALDEAAGVVAAAEERWRSDPTYPRVTPQTSKATKPATGGKGKASPVEKRPPAAPTVILPTITPTPPALPGPAPQPKPPASATVPVPPVAETSAQDTEPTEVGQLVTPAVGGPPLQIRKPRTDAKKPGDRKQLSLFG